MRRWGKIVSLLGRYPSLTNLNDGIVSHIERQEVNTSLALQQWENYIDIIARFSNCKLVEVPKADSLADGVFVEDCVINIADKCFIFANPGNDLRKPEVPSVRETVEKMMIANRKPLPLHTIQHPGTLDGGDVLQVPSQRVIYIGNSARTNLEGISQFQRAVGPDYRVVIVPVTRVLHLKSAVTALPDGGLIIWPPALCTDGIRALSKPSGEDHSTEITRMPEECGAHVVVLNYDTVLMSASAPQSKVLLETKGYHVLTADISEFEKLEGCVTCLSVRVREHCH